MSSMTAESLPPAIESGRDVPHFGVVALLALALTSMIIGIGSGYPAPDEAIATPMLTQIAP